MGEMFPPFILEVIVISSYWSTAKRIRNGSLTALRLAFRQYDRVEARIVFPRDYSIHSSEDRQGRVSVSLVALSNPRGV